MQKIFLCWMGPRKPTNSSSIASSKETPCSYSVWNGRSYPPSSALRKKHPCLVKGRGPIRPCSLRNGVRAPSPRICFATGKNGYLYDELTGVSRFHILVFTSDLRGPIRNALAAFSRQAFHDSSGFYSQFGGAGPFNIILITKAQPWETGVLLGPRDNNDDLRGLRKNATVLYDNRVPDENAHYLYGINHARGAVVVVRPDLAVGVSVFPMGVGALESYFASFLLPVKECQGLEELEGANGGINDAGEKGLTDNRASDSRDT